VVYLLDSFDSFDSAFERGGCINQIKQVKILLSKWIVLIWREKCNVCGRERGGRSSSNLLCVVKKPYLGHHVSISVPGWLGNSIHEQAVGRHSYHDLAPPLHFHWFYSSYFGSSSWRLLKENTLNFNRSDTSPVRYIYVSYGEYTYHVRSSNVMKMYRTKPALGGWVASSGLPRPRNLGSTFVSLLQTPVNSRKAHTGRHFSRFRRKISSAWRVSFRHSFLCWFDTNVPVVELYYSDRLDSVQNLEKPTCLRDWDGFGIQWKGILG
jgi:hypothetical protein